jgi:aminoglycoside phosphotransferase (APT) family kinase protein
VTAFVDDATVRAAAARAATRELTAVERERWARLQDWARAGAGDPQPARTAALRAVLNRPRAGDAAVLIEAGQRLGASIDGADASDDGTREVRRLCRQWLADDVHAAAPLLELFTGHHRDPEGGPPAADPWLVSALQEWLAARLGPQTRIESAAVLSGGFSRLMLDVRWRDADGSGRGVFRIEQDGMFATAGAREVIAMRAVRAAGYPVPEVLWEEPGTDVVGAPFFVMEHVPGAARTDEPAIADMLRALADLHALERPVVDAVARLDGVDAGAAPETAITAQLDHWHRVYTGAVPLPIPWLEHGFAWLRSNLVPSGPTVIVHGDPGPGNALQDDAGVTAVIDWEFAHAGDAAEDWAYLALIRGRRLAAPAQWKARIATTVGVEFDDATWHAWEVYNNVKGACVNLTALDVFRRSPRPNPDLLAIGVAVHLRFLQRVAELTTNWE